jgi:hypothetical protein
VTPKRRDPTVPRWWAVTFCTVIVVAVTGVVGLGRRRIDPTPAAVTRVRWAALMTPDAARRTLRGLAVTEPTWEVAYDRTRDFGPAWSDVDHNGCDTRDDILRRDLDAVTFRPGTARCVVVSGTLADPYSGATLRFSKADADAVQIDHLVPLHAAWVLGAWRWSAERRLAFANDPRNLVAVDGAANQAKSYALVDRWRPANDRIHCVYAINTVAVHAAYQLAVTRPERHMLARLLSPCR